MIHATIISLCLLIMAAPALAQKRIALLIGNQDYKRGVGKLVNPFNDIRIVGAALRKVGFDVMKPVRNATRADILEAVDNYAARLKKAGPDAIGFIYYSGHGIASRGKNYLIPIDIAKPSTRLLRANGVKQSEVLDIIRQEAPQAAHYFIIDACRNELQGARGAKGFVAVNQQAGTLIAFATSPGRTASDLGDGSGPYAKALAAELVKPGVTDLQMFSNVRYAVASATGNDQVPWALDGIVRRDRLMFGGSNTSQPDASWPAVVREKIANAETIEELDALLRLAPSEAASIRSKKQALLAAKQKGAKVIQAKSYKLYVRIPGTPIAWLQGSEERSFIEHAKQGRRATVSAIMNDGRRFTANFSLQGVTAALSYLSKAEDCANSNTTVKLAAFVDWAVYKGSKRCFAITRSSNNENTWFSIANFPNGTKNEPSFEFGEQPKHSIQIDIE